MSNCNQSWKVRHKETLSDFERLKQLESEIVGLRLELNKTKLQFRGVVATLSKRLRSMEILNVSSAVNGTKSKSKTKGAVARKHDRMFLEMIEQEREFECDD